MVDAITRLRRLKDIEFGGNLRCCIPHGPKTLQQRETCMWLHPPGFAQSLREREWFERRRATGCCRKRKAAGTLRDSRDSRCRYKDGVSFALLRGRRLGEITTCRLKTWSGVYTLGAGSEEVHERIGMKKVQGILPRSRPAAADSIPIVPWHVLHMSSGLACSRLICRWNSNLSYIDNCELSRYLDAGSSLVFANPL